MNACEIADEINDESSDGSNGIATNAYSDTEEDSCLSDMELEAAER